MPSTYSTRNRLEKQASGENSNTWGTRFNASGGSDMLDAALDGRTTFTLSGSKTLTTVDGATDESRSRFLDITSGTGGTVTIPNLEKCYLVRNATSGDVIFTTGSGTTATVETGVVGWIVSTGSNVVYQTKIDLTSQVTGALPVANGGTAGTTAGDARTNLGLGTAATQNTGTSGANVALMSTSNVWADRQIMATVTVGNAGTTTPAAVTENCVVDGDVISIGSSSGVFWENRSGGVTTDTNWYGWYTAAGVIYLWNGGSNIASINSSTGAYTALSDRNRKTDITPSPYGLGSILAIPTYLYRVIGAPADAPLELGLMAQDLQESLPPAYSESEFTDADGETHKFIGVNQMPLIAALIESVKTLNARITALEAA